LAIKISRDARKQLIDSIKCYFAENMEEEIGELKAELLLDYFLVEIAPSVYNRAIVDAQVYFQEKTADLDGSCYEKEFGFWS